MLIMSDDTTGWSMAGLVLGLMFVSEIWLQALFIILFPALGWTLLYFVKREIVYRFPPKTHDTLVVKNLKEE